MISMNVLLLLTTLCLSIECSWTNNFQFGLINSTIDLWSTLTKNKIIEIPNLKGCQKTKTCFIDLLTSTGFSTDPLPNYGLYLMEMTKFYSSGKGLKKYCGTFDAVSQCFSEESDSCRTTTVFETLFDLTRDDAYRYSSDLDLRKILCDNQQEMEDPCLNNMSSSSKSVPIEKDAQASCDNVAADLSAVISKADDTGCPDSVLSLFCQISAKTKEIETLGACDGKIPKCWTKYHSCDRMQGCFDEFYDGVEKAGVSSPLPDYVTYASNMKRRFENANGIEEMCRLQENLHACLIRHIDKNCPLNAASFRSMYNMNYEQAYDYSTDFNLRKAQCINKEGVKKNDCLTRASRVLSLCKPNIPHNLTLERSCTDLRLAMQCNNFAVRQVCPEEVQKMYCETEGIIYQQNSLGFCDGWMPECEFQTTVSPQKTSVIPTISTGRTITTDSSTTPSTRATRSIDDHPISNKSSTEITTTNGLPTTSLGYFHISFACAVLLKMRTIFL